ncbi:hypothetical protein Trydic_g13916 [Trypoxylus dichotomus]
MSVPIETYSKFEERTVIHPLHAANDNHQYMTTRNLLKIDTLTRENHRLKVWEAVLLTGISKSPLHEIVSELGYRKDFARWVLKLLTDQYKM